MMIQVNLLPEELRRKQGVSIALPDLPIKKVFTIFFPLFLTAQIALSGYAVFQKSRIKTIETEIETLRTQTKHIARRKNEIISINGRTKEIESLTERRFFWTSVIAELTSSVSKGVWLTGLSVVETHEAETKSGDKKSGAAPKIRDIYYLRLEGSASGEGQETAFVGKYIKEIKDNPLLGDLFGDVKLSTINQKKIRDIDVYDFVLMCVFKEGRY